MQLSAPPHFNSRTNQASSWRTWFTSCTEDEHYIGLTPTMEPLNVQGLNPESNNLQTSVIATELLLSYPVILCSDPLPWDCRWKLCQLTVSSSGLRWGSSWGNQLYLPDQCLGVYELPAVKKVSAVMASYSRRSVTILTSRVLAHDDSSCVVMLLHWVRSENTPLKVSNVFSFVFRFWSLAWTGSSDRVLIQCVYLEPCQPTFQNIDVTELASRYRIDTALFEFAWLSRLTRLCLAQIRVCVLKICSYRVL